MSSSYTIHPWSVMKLIGLSTVLAWGVLVPGLWAQVPEEPEATVPTETEAESVMETEAEMETEADSEASTPAPESGNSLFNRSAELDLAPNPNPLNLPLTPEEVTITRTRAISLQDAIAIARENNQTARIQVLQVDRQEAALRQQQAQLWPTLTLNSNLQNTGTDTNVNVSRQDLLNGNSGDTTQNTTSLNSAVRLDYTIFDFTRNPTIRAAEQLVRQAELQLEQTLEELDRDVAVDYYNLQQADEQVRIFEQSVRAAERSLEDAQALERAGVGTRFAVLQSEVQLSNERQNLVNAQSDQLQARRQLAQRLSLPQDAEIVAADPVAKAGSWELSLEESIILAYQGRPELARRLVEREANEYQRKAQLGAIKPALSLFGQYTIDQSFTNTSREQFTGTNDTNQDSLTNQYQVGVNLQWRFFDGGAAKAAARQEEVDISVSELQFADDRNQIRQQVEVAFYEVESNLKNIDTATRGVEQAQEALRLARLRFQAGVGTQIDVINAERDLTQSEGNLATAILGYNQALAQLKQAVSQ
ncbi:MAG: TolC family protein [Prochlorotrichaceae cyanobacterium]